MFQVEIFWTDTDEICYSLQILVESTFMTFFSVYYLSRNAAYLSTVFDGNIHYFARNLGRISFFQQFFQILVTIK